MPEDQNGTLPDCMAGFNATEVDWLVCCGMVVCWALMLGIG
jgi:hypothetical protein